MKYLQLKSKWQPSVLKKCKYILSDKNNGFNFSYHAANPYLCAKFRRSMGSKCMKSLLVAVFSLFLLAFSTNVFSQEKPADHKKSEEKFDPTKAIMNHVQDAYEFHFFSTDNFEAAIYLPVILYSPQKGLSVFSSKRFGPEHDKTYDGYRMEGENSIVPIDPDVKVYDFSLTRNVIQTFLALGAVLFPDD